MKLTRRLFAASALICVSVAAFAVGTLALPDGAAAEGTKRIGVSWRHFQEERWRIDEAGIKSVLEPAGYDIRQRGRAGRPAEAARPTSRACSPPAVDALIILAQDSKAILPAIDARQGGRRSGHRL